MARIPLCLFALSSLWFSTFALDIQGRIQWNDVCKNYEELGPSKVVLDNGRLSGSVTVDGSFTIPDVQPGEYLLSIQSHNYTFDQLRVDVTPTDTEPTIHPFIIGTPFNPVSSITIPFPVILTPRSKNAWFVPKEGFNLLEMFRNPMMLIMVFTGVMMFAMPYIMKSMDPEMLEDFKDRQAKMNNIQSSIQSGDIKSGLSALLARDEEPKTAGARSQPGSSGTQQNRNRGNKNKKR